MDDYQIGLRLGDNPAVPLEEFKAFYRAAQKNPRLIGKRFEVWDGDTPHLASIHDGRLFGMIPLHPRRNYTPDFDAGRRYVQELAEGRRVRCRS